MDMANISIPLNTSPKNIPPFLHQNDIVPPMRSDK